jgi:hypothetical protein
MYFIQTRYIRLSTRALFIFIVILTLGSLGAFNSHAETAAQSTATATLAPTNAATIDISQTMDKLVDVGGYRLFVHCTGQGTPAVVMDAGFGNTGTTGLKYNQGCRNLPEYAHMTVLAWARANQAQPLQQACRWTKSCILC